MSHELLVFGFDDPPAHFEGRLLGALERAESGGALRTVEVLFAARDADTRALSAAVLRVGSGGLVTALVDFRLDEERRRAATVEAFAADRTGALARLGDALVPGAAVVGILVERVWADALADAAERSGGRPLLDAPAAATDTSVLAAQVLAVVQASGAAVARH